MALTSIYFDRSLPYILLLLSYLSRVTSRSGHCIALCIVAPRSLPISQRILSFITAPRINRWWCSSSVLGIVFGIVGGEGYIRVLASTAPEPSVVNHWSTHHRKEGRIHERGWYAVLSTQLVWHNANKGYGESYITDGWSSANWCWANGSTSATVIKTKVAPVSNFDHVLDQFVSWN